MKHIVMLFDGTWNSAATGHYDDITNIFRLNLAVSRHDAAGNQQVVFYIPGPGTRGLGDEQLGGITGQGIDQIIREAYVNLSSNYSQGDLIYLFGFSRGAVAARALSCLIAESGLLKPQRLHLLPTAWKRFVNINRGEELHPGLRDLTEDVHEGVRIKFLGVFDSVLGREASQPTHFSELVFSNNAFSSIIDRALQILSIDDCRKSFEPLVWDSYNPEKQHIEQIWMPGVHSDVGGVGAPHFLGIVSLLTMISSISRYTDIKINDNFLQEFKDRLKFIDKVFINDERYSVFKLPFTREFRIAPSHGVEQKIHAIVQVLFDRNFLNRGDLRIYRGAYLTPFLALPVATDDYAELARLAALDALGKVH